ncbi:MAG: hypothetical protein P4L69_00665 [Desulfosporosinus sp.]|nr:hypothetical protein [Desulfosporosinus sp.]
MLKAKRLKKSGGETGTFVSALIHKGVVVAQKIGSEKNNENY